MVDLEQIISDLTKIWIEINKTETKQLENEEDTLIP
jgi:hypothetical protein